VRIFCAIFSFYLLALALMPCSDGGHEGKTSYEASQVALAEDHPEPCCDFDFCSPLCPCDCCGMSCYTFKLPSAILADASFEIGQVDDIYLAPFTSEHASLLFRPPIS